MHASGTAVKAAKKSRTIEITGNAVIGELGNGGGSLAQTNSEHKGK